MRKSLLALVAILACSVAVASQKSTLAISAITSQQSEIRAGVQAGTGRYKGLSAKTKAELLSRQSEVLALVNGKQSAAELNEADRLTVFNHLEWIEAAINDESGDELVCTRTKKLGTNRAERVCKTARQIEEEKEYARMNMNSGCAGGVCGNP